MAALTSSDLPITGLPRGLPDSFPFPPSTGPTFPWPDDAQGRDEALDFGRVHADAIAAVERLADEYGGGTMGAVKGFLYRYVQSGLIGPRDSDRLLAILEALRSADPETGSQRILELHAQAMDDPLATPAALAVTSIAANTAARTMANDPHEADVWAAGYADGVAAVFTLGFGPLVFASSTYVASDLAYHTHVSYR